MEHDLYILMIFDPYNVSLAIATNIPVILNMTGFVLQGHILWCNTVCKLIVTSEKGLVFCF